MGDGHIIQGLSFRRQDVAKINVSKKPELARAKHNELLKGTEYRKTCADCNGTTGRLNSDGHMLCSNVNGVPVPVTVTQAKKCDGTKPPPYNQGKQKQYHKPNPIFRKPERRV